LPGDFRYRSANFLRKLGRGIANPPDRSFGAELRDGVGFET
jgi:hypothetical protein